MLTNRGNLLLAVLILCACAALAQDEAMFRHDLAHTGVFSGAAPKSISHVLWQFKTGGRVFSSPVVADGVVYVASMDGNVYALH